LLAGRHDIIGVEVGVADGDNARNILIEWDIAALVGVEIDPLCEPVIRERLACCRNFGLVTADSSVAAQLFPDEAFDFAYIDDDHDGDGPLRSLSAWYPKVKAGGVLCGHDYPVCTDVERAVVEFFAEHRMVLGASEWDFWGVKPLGK
jgi:hypothetical protein